MTDGEWHLAQLNIGRLVAPEGDPRVADFFADLDRINALADAAPGFVWRLVDDDGGDATGLRPFGDETLVNLSVWETVESLHAFTFRSGHVDLLRRRREWFHALDEAYAVLWWIPAGTLPTVGQAIDRLDRLRAEGPTGRAFTFRTPFSHDVEAASRWPVWLGSTPLDPPWSVGDRVVTRLRWCDDPDLPDHLALRKVRVRATVLRGADEQPWAHLVEADGLVAVRSGHHTSGEITISGCLSYDDLLRIVGDMPSTTGVVRRIRVVSYLYDRGADGWVRRPDAPRLTDVPDASPARLSDGPPPEARAPSTGSFVFLSPEQHFQLARDRLPPQQWQAHGFLIDLEV